MSVSLQCSDFKDIRNCRKWLQACSRFLVPPCTQQFCASVELLKEWRAGVVRILNPKDISNRSLQKDIGVAEWQQVVSYTLSFLQRSDSFVTTALIDHLVQLYPLFLRGAYTRHPLVPPFVVDRFNVVSSAPE